MTSSPDTDRTGPYTFRRLLVLGLNFTTIVALGVTMGHLLSPGGWTIVDVGMLIAFVSTLPWISIGFWNALIGFFILHFSRDPAGFVTPSLRAVGDDDRIACRVAIAMTIRNEKTSEALARLRVIKSELDATPGAERFDYHVLSDTSDPEIALEEEATVRDWQRNTADPSRIHYRRRTENSGFKAGNVWEFVTRCIEDYDFFVPLDADSLMSGAAITRLVRVIQNNPKIGILQGLVVGRPADSFFARVFQFGMRHGMRSYTTGSAWWHGDCGPFWGHNAIIRLRPFKEHCALPTIPGNHALSGPILSHDQVEAVLMRRAGYECRVIAEEDESWEDNPPTLPDFIKRDLRWCQGNMQYWWLLGMPGLPIMSRVQLLLAILMYVGAPGWMLFIVLGVAQVLFYPGVPFPTEVGLALFIAVISMSLMPKIVGVLDVLTSHKSRQTYGGGLRVAVGAFLEIMFSSLLAPIVSFAQSRFMLGLVFGKTIGWGAQRRESVNLGILEAFRGLWPQTLFGLALLGVLYVTMPVLVLYATPILVSMIGAVPLAVGTASPLLQRLSASLGLCDIPEDRNAAPTLKLLPKGA